MSSLYERRIRKLQGKAQKGAWDLRCAIKDITQGVKGEDAKIVFPDCTITLEWKDEEGEMPSPLVLPESVVEDINKNKVEQEEPSNADE